MDLLGGYGGDTGGRLFPELSRKGKNNGTFINYSVVNYENSNMSYELYDHNWVHTVALCNWDEKSEAYWIMKRNLIETLLKKYLNY